MTQSALLKPYLKDGKLTLYRGLNCAQADLFNRLRGGDLKVLGELFRKERDALFFTPDEKTAWNWSRGCYVEITFLEADFDALYAVTDPRVLIKSIASLKVHVYSK
jgi:hypothetical protein